MHASARPRFEELGVKVLPMKSVCPMGWAKADHFGAAKICTEFKDLEKCRKRFPDSTTLSFWTGTWQTSGPRGKKVSRIAIDAQRQAMLGLRGYNELNKRVSIGDLEKRAGYVGKSSNITIF